jgi:hypothetical protein
VIGDYGSCNQDKEQQYSWRIDWGDGEVHEKKLESIGPYQSVHTYAKKGKNHVEVTFCAKYKKCDAACTTISKPLMVLP